MTVVVVEPPAPVLDAETLRRLVPGLSSLSDDDLDLLIGAAQQMIEPPSGWVGRSFGRQTLQLVLDRFPCGAISLHYPPVQSIDQIAFVDEGGEEQTLEESTYRAGLAGISARVAPVGAWPKTMDQPQAVRITYVTGYEADDPALRPVRHAIALAVQELRSMAREDLFLRRERIDGVDEYEWTVSTVAGDLLRSASERLLRPLWVPRL